MILQIPIEISMVRWLHQPVTLPMYQLLVLLLVLTFLLLIVFTPIINKLPSIFADPKVPESKTKNTGNELSMLFEESMKSQTSTKIITFNVENSREITVKEHIIQKSTVSFDCDSVLIDFMSKYIDIDSNDLESSKKSLENINKQFLDKLNLTLNDVVLIKKPNSTKFEVSFTNEGFKKIAASEFKASQKMALTIGKHIKDDILDIHYNNNRFLKSFDNVSVLGSGSFGVVR